VTLGSQKYLSLLNQVDAVVGNSSSGLTEAPSFRKATINIGDRQRGRLKAASVIDCPPDRDAIAAALRTAYSPAFADRLATVRNPYGEPGASERIVRILAEFPLSDLLKKIFYNVPVGEAMT
jgi:GDP/UDP-N,N'-diacetylbacillosamine 2-epimerase (hydrolysing)